MINKPATKGELTAERILDCAEPLFARKGYDSCSLRDIAKAANIKEPGLYNYFNNKEALFAAVLERALNPIAETLEQHLNTSEPLSLAELPSIITDLLLLHPNAAAFFSQALNGYQNSDGTQLSNHWLKKLLRLGGHVYRQQFNAENMPSDAEIAIHIIALFNLCVGYFQAQRAFDTLASGNLHSEDNIKQQKLLLHAITSML